MDGEQSEHLTVERQIERAVLPHTEELVGLAPGEAHRNIILAVHWKIMPNESAAARAERHVLTHAIDLIEPVRDRIGLVRHRHRGIADGQPADPAGRGKIPLHQQRRHLQHVADIVEAVAGVVGRQHLGNLDLDRQQIANGVGVFGAVEAMQRGPSGIGLELRGAIALGLDEPDQGPVGGLVRPRQTGGRHLAVAQLAQQLLPDLAVALQMVEIQSLQVQSGRRLGADMALDAIQLPGLPSRILTQRRAGGGCCRRFGAFSGN